MHIPLRIRLPLLLLVLVGLPGCATQGTMGEAAGILTLDDMERSGATNLYDAIDRLRPRWLQVRSARSLGLPHEVVVYRGPSFLGSLEVLRGYPVGSVTHVEYLDSAQAAATLTGYGSRHLEGAIILHWRAGPPPPPGCSLPRPCPIVPVVAGGSRFPLPVTGTGWERIRRSS